MLLWRTIGLDALDTSDRSALERQRTAGLVNLQLLLLAGPMVGFGVGFFVLLGDPWLGQFGALYLNRRGHSVAARLIGCALAGLVYCDLLTAFGTNCGIELWSIPMVAFPPLFVLRSERRLLLKL